jgi:hypothetical protein
MGNGSGDSVDGDSVVAETKLTTYHMDKDRQSIQNQPAINPSIYHVTTTH